MEVIHSSLDACAFKLASWGGVILCVPLLSGCTSSTKIPTIRWRSGLVATLRTRGALVVGIEVSTRERTLQCFLGRVGDRTTAAVLLHLKGGRHGFSISRKANPPMCVPSDPTPHGIIGGSQTKAAAPTACARPILFAIVLAQV